MKTIFAFLILVSKIYIGGRVIWWIIQKFYEPTEHSISEIEVFLAFLVFDIWISKQPEEIEKYK